MYSLAEQKKIDMEKIIIWIGDQLIAEWMQGLYRFRGQDNNSFEQMDWLVILFGWFHLYLGSTVDRGLMHTFTLLEKKRLNTVQTRGSFHQNLHDAICHVTEAHFHTCWKVVAGVENLAELQSKFPSQLQALTVDIVEKLASSEALHHAYAYFDKDQNDVLCASIMWNRDALRYVDLDDTIKSGDVGVMEETLPHLLFYFVDGNNSKYAIEVLKLLQCLYHEWPLELALITHQTQGPNASWDDMKRTGLAIPMLHAICKHLERQIYTLYQECNLQTLDNAYQSSDIHVQVNRWRARGKSDQVTDIVTNDNMYLLTRKMVAK
ncbi:hypothetical protein F5I97DRAFT_1934861 [Phlebopus sp. FC_14]|nr:hypothetical protein F5I97DRAFT_1934861 [Phlebopus sp. FC_14]